MIAPEPAAAAPDPESARYFLARLRQDFPSAYQRIVANPAALRAAVPSAVDFARFRRRQLLRILLRDVLDAATLSNVTEELSNLADAILDVAYRRIRAE